MALIEANNLKKTYLAGYIPVNAIRGVSFSLPPSSFVSFIGPSGSGKSLLLNIKGCLDPPSSGLLTVTDQEVSPMNAG